MRNERVIDIKGDASGNVLVAGDGNIVRVVIAQNSHFFEAVSGENPFRGLQAFEERHALQFFGREEITARLWEMGSELLSGKYPRVLMVLGRSGSGKSSVVRAGLLAALGRRHWPYTDIVGAAVFVPGGDPIAAFNAAVAQARDAVNSHPPGRSRLVIVADQFETLFTSGLSDERKGAFISHLIEAATSDAGEIVIVGTMRTDFIGALQSFPEFERIVAEPRHHRIVAAMNRSELATAIIGPTATERLFPEPLVEALVDQAEGREGALPLLRYTLTQIWEAMARGQEPQAYFMNTLQGSIANAIAREGDLLLSELKDNRRKSIAIRAFARMIELHDQSFVRRSVTVQSLLKRGETAEEVLSILRHFAERRARLLTLSGELGLTTAESNVVASITHGARFGAGRHFMIR